MNEAASFAGIFGGNQMAYAVGNMIAHEGSRRIGYRSRDSLFLNFPNHVFDGEGDEIGIRAVSIAGLVDDLVSFVIRNAAVGDRNAEVMGCGQRKSCGSSGDDAARQQKGDHTQRSGEKYISQNVSSSILQIG